MKAQFESLEAAMRRALVIAERGLGRVEPNPAVGAVVVDDDLRLLGEGWHQQFGGPHAEVNAIQDVQHRHAELATGSGCRGATLVCTLEPCSHHGKTPPCAKGVIDAGFRRVVIATSDPAPHVNGRGIELLRNAGIEVEVGLCERDAKRLIAPFVTLMLQNRPYVHAKWAMSLDGRIATRSGVSQWISSPESRQKVHEFRGGMDAILVGIGTALADDPLLTARPPGPRTPLRIVLDSRGRLPLESQLVRTAHEVPLLVVCVDASDEFRDTIASAGGEVLLLPNTIHGDGNPTDVVDGMKLRENRVCLRSFLEELGRRRLTNLLIEGGGHVLGSFRDLDLIDAYHVDIAPIVIGGQSALSPVLGVGSELLPSPWEVTIQSNGPDVHVVTTRPIL